MKLISRVGQSIFGNPAAALLIVFLIQITTANNVDRFNSRKLSDDQKQLFRYKRGTLLPPTLQSYNSSTLLILSNQISKLQEEVEILNRSSSLSVEDKMRVASLETIAKELEKNPDILRNELIEKDNTNMMIITTIIEILEAVLFDDIIQHIKSKQFVSAERKLKLASDVNYENIVEEVYNHNADNIDILRSFGEFIPDADRKFKVYDALFNQMRANGHGDVWQLIRLGQAVKKEILNHTTNATAAELLFENLLNAIQPVAIETITNLFLNNGSWSEVGAFGTTLVNDFPQSFVNNISKEVIDKIINSLDVQTILNEAKNIKNLELEMVILRAVFDKMQDTNILSTNAVILLARYVKTVMENSNYDNLDSELRNRHEDIKSKLPISVKNLVFSTAVCLKNTVHNEYLYAGTDQELVDLERRFVFTWIPQNRNDSTFKWYVKFRDDNSIYLVNAGFKEYLFGHRTNTYDYRRRYVLTWRKAGGETLDDSTWDVEVADTDAIRIKNKYYSEYLYADFYELRDDERRSVFTFIPKTKTKDSEWKVIDC